MDLTFQLEDRSLQNRYKKSSKYILSTVDTLSRKTQIKCKVLKLFHEDRATMVLLIWDKLDFQANISRMKRNIMIKLKGEMQKSTSIVRILILYLNIWSPNDLYVKDLKTVSTSDIHITHTYISIIYIYSLQLYIKSSVIKLYIYSHTHICNWRLHILFKCRWKSHFDHDWHHES